MQLLSGCAGFRLWQSEKHLPDIPAVPREFRAAWVASVSNIHWPSRPGLSVEQQQQEALAILDTLEKYHFNAVIFQVRPQCDALYDSPLEPWSYYLTGTQSAAPQPYYDPLAFWIAQAHARGLELHAWFNPYRAHCGSTEPSAASVVKQHPEWVVRLKNGTYWLDPALRQTQDYSYAVVMDVVRRYDIDGIHFDDYFYPYPSYNGGDDFPDEAGWRAYQQHGGKLSRNDWRRAAVNQFIQRVYKGIKQQKPHVKFGLSPFGIWRPGYPPSIAGLDQYDTLYADARLWLQKGWVDYWTPQLYWPIQKIPQSFPVLLGWWKEQNRCNRHIWPGIRNSNGRDETLNQIMVTRGMLADSPGVVHWHINALRENDFQLARALLDGPYAQQALAPASPWLDKKPPARPVGQLETVDGRPGVTFSHRDENDIVQWVVYVRRNNRWNYHILPQPQRRFTLPDAAFTEIAVTAVDRCGNESAPFVLEPVPVD